MQHFLRKVSLCLCGEAGVWSLLTDTLFNRPKTKILFKCKPMLVQCEVWDFSPILIFNMVYSDVHKPQTWYCPKRKWESQMGAICTHKGDVNFRVCLTCYNSCLFCHSNLILLERFQFVHEWKTQKDCENWNRGWKMKKICRPKNHRGV